jgi:hypothetical protein
MYKIAYVAFAATVVFGMTFDKKYELSKTKYFQFGILALMVTLQIVGAK